MIRLVHERKQRGWSQMDVCMKTGIHPATLSRLERQQMPAYPGWRQRLAEAFGIPGDQLFELVKEPVTAQAL
jgi:transcriptional regulator with XRE-family HTH domain